MHSQDQTAIEKICRTYPVWIEQRTAKDALNLKDNELLHAGPPFKDATSISRPIINSACCAAVYEGLAKDLLHAEQLIQSGDLKFTPAQNHNAVIPLAGVISPSMQLHVVVDSSNPTHKIFAPINGGSGPAMRLGQKSQEVIGHLHWVNGEFNDWLCDSTQFNVDLIKLAVHGLTQGDDCHGRTPAATQKFLASFDQKTHHGVSMEYLKSSPSFFLNLWMAACKCMLSAADHMENCSVVTTAGGNGTHVGIQVSGLPGQWITIEAEPPVGDTGDFVPERALGAIGDSAIVDAAGFGAMAISLSPIQKQALQVGLPDKADSLPAKLLPSVHPGFGSLGIRTGLNARTVIEVQDTPIVALGILDKLGEKGRIGGGIYQVPINLFASAMEIIEGHST